MEYTPKRNFQQATQARRIIEVEIKVARHRHLFTWNLIIYCGGKKAVLRWGLLNQRECKNAERAWLHALDLAFEWRDRNAPGGRLQICESARHEGRQRVA
jgi:hypothetical protein